MKFVIVGAGAIGTYLAAKLSAVGNEVWLVARGRTFEALRTGDVVVRSPIGDFSAKLHVTDNYEEPGVADFVMLTVKADSVPEVSPSLPALLGVDTAVVPVQNGIPWWYFLRHGGELEGTMLERLDPDGLAAEIPIERVIGCVLKDMAASAPAPGVVEHLIGNQLSIGEPDGTMSERCSRLAEAMENTGLRCSVSPQIRAEIWDKLLKNMSTNPISALTRATLGEISWDTEVLDLVRAVMEEANAVAEALGVETPTAINENMAVIAGGLGPHKTSMLQDVESSRSIELDAIVGAPIDIGEMLEVPMPSARAVYAIMKLLGESVETSAIASRLSE